MKLKIVLKDPDGVHESVRRGVEHSIDVGCHGLNAREREHVLEERLEQAFDGIRPWVEHGEYLTVDIDTDAGTATVRRVRA